ncbi:MAG: GtrA family protein [Desulfobacula sp.]|nr:GtrA family protein [Desulfobacula sp.]
MKEGQKNDTFLLKENQMRVIADFIRYIVVGGLAFIIDFSCLVFFTEIVGFHYLVSAPIAFIISLIFSYLLCVKWVFKYRVFTNKRIESSIFCVVGLFGILITEGILTIFTPVVGDYKIVKIISTAVVLFWNFFMRRYLLFKPAQIKKSNSDKRPAQKTFSE